MLGSPALKERGTSGIGLVRCWAWELREALFNSRLTFCGRLALDSPTVSSSMQPTIIIGGGSERRRILAADLAPLSSLRVAPNKPWLWRAARGRVAAAEEQPGGTIPCRNPRS